MANLVFEIWRDDAEDEQSMSQVSPEADKLRAAIMPNATLIHSFVATSDFDALQKNYNLNGWGVWRREPHCMSLTITQFENQAT